jgi:hypothetical protein
MDEGIPRPEKGKRKANENGEESGPQENGRSLGTRILDSAAGLMSNFATGSNGELASILASSSAMGGKSQGATTSTGDSAWRDRINAPQLQTDGGSSRLQNPNIYDSFRSLHVKTPIDPEMDAFMTDTTFHSNLDGNAGGTASAWSNQFNTSTGSDTSRHNNDMNGHHNGAYIPEIHDGAEVTQLLSDPTLLAGTDAMDMDMTEDLTQEQINDLFPQNFTPTEQQMVDHMRSALPPAPTHKPILFDSLNLRPTQRVDIAIQDLAASLETGLDSSLFATPALRERWFSEWNDVLNSYVDEVWGELLPEVQTARTQLEEVRIGGNSLDSKAIERLKMILGHVSQQGPPDIQPPTKRARRAWSGEHDVSAKPEFHCPWITCHEVCLDVCPR